MRTYYDVLGVSEETPDIVLKAAFRALAKEYHPDGAAQNTADPHRFIEIQDAYAVLSKHASRSAYDAGLREAIKYSAMDAGLRDGSSVQVPGSLEALEGGPSVERICARLSLYSDILGQAFYDAYRRGECGADPAAYAEDMERDFFRQYFSADPDVQALARLLLLRSRTDAAMALNELVSGEGSTPSASLRSQIAQALDKHLSDDPLFAEWLKVKLGFAAIVPAKTLQRNVSGVPQHGNGWGSTKVPRPAAHSLGKLFVWATALYFTLFAAFPLLQ